jgi:hypothetical protein
MRRGGENILICDGMRLAVLKALGHGAKGEHFRFSHGFVGGRAVAQDARKLRNLSNPAAINLFLAFDAEIHD